jgi:uncharacterized protein (TIGR03083 family)
MSSEPVITLSVDKVMAALRHSHERLVSCLAALPDEQADAPSYADEWSIAQVASHLGSGAEIFTLFLEAGSRREPAPGLEQMQPIWDRWNAKGAPEQVHDAVAADASFLGRLAALGDAERQEWRLDLFGGKQELAAVLRLRLGEHAMHTWDIAVALDATATVPTDAVGLLVDTLEGLVARVGKPVGGEPLQVDVTTHDPARRFLLELRDDGARLTRADAGVPGEAPGIWLPAEAFLRLVYGRLDRDHTPPTANGDVDLDLLRRAFPGF